jgi:hypothetical protein
MPSEMLRRVGMACFVACFDAFQREAQGRAARYATLRAMRDRGGAQTDQSAATKAHAGVWILKNGLEAAALAAVTGSERVPAEVRVRARELLADLRK